MKKVKGLGYYGYGDLKGFDMKRVNEIVRILGGRVEKKKAIERGITSYGIKHIVERQPESRNGLLGGYVSNGELIYAMSLLGFDVVWIGDSRNACFNVSRKSLKGLRATEVK